MKKVLIRNSKAFSCCKRITILLQQEKVLFILKILDIVTRFKDYAKYPVTIFSPVFRFIFTFLIPIAFIAYYPSLVILRPGEVPLLSWLSPFIVSAFFIASYNNTEL